MPWIPSVAGPDSGAQQPEPDSTLVFLQELPPPGTLTIVRCTCSHDRYGTGYPHSENRPYSTHYFIIYHTYYSQPYSPGNGCAMDQKDGILRESPEECLQSALIKTIHQADRSAANALIDTWAAEHGYEHLFIDILEPVLKKIGDEWAFNDSVTLAQAYVAAKIAEDVLTKIASQISPSEADQPEKGPIVFGNIEDDFHSLGRRMVVTFLRINGWNVIDLGNDVEPDRFVDTAIKAGARIIGVSAMTLTTAMNIKKLRAEIDSRGLTGRIQLAVGGAVFLACPNLVQDVGGDGTAANAMRAVAMCDQLFERSLHFKGGKDG